MLAVPEPIADRPRTQAEYGIPDGPDGMLPWSWAVERLERALTYWVATVRPDGRPHVMPAWGAWLPDGCYFEGGPGTRRARNLAANAEAVVTLGDDDVAIVVEGQLAGVSEVGPQLEAALLAGFGKYREPFDYTPDPAGWIGGLWRLSPRTIFGWTASGFPGNATRWRIAAQLEVRS